LEVVASLDRSKSNNLKSADHLEQQPVKIRGDEEKTTSSSIISTSSNSNNQSNEISDNQNKHKHVFLAFARVFSGTLKKGQHLFLLSPKHNCEDFIGKNFDSNGCDEEELKKVSKHVSKFTIDDIYLMMGRELEPIDQVAAGNICAIGGLDNLLLKSATLSSTLYCPSFASMQLQASPIVHVAIEPKNPCKPKNNESAQVNVNS
jgi:ribosome assembly protein 1